MSALVDNTFNHEYEENTSTATGKVGKIKPNPGIKHKKIPLKLDIETLDLLLAYAYDTDSKYITRSALSNLHSMISMCNLNLYRNNQSLRARIDFILLLLEARLHMGFDNKKILLNYAMEKCEYRELIREEVIVELNKLKLNSRAVQYLNSYVADRLVYGFMFSYKDDMMKMWEDLESHNYPTLKSLTQQFKELITNLLFDIRNAENYSEDNMTLDLSDGNFENIITQIVKKLQDPSNKLMAGVKALNQMLNGGFEQSRSYLFFGMTGVGKSVLLLNLLIFLKMHNVVKPKDPTKRPAALYISQENTIAETVERLFNMQVADTNIRDYTPAEVVKLLRTKGQLTLTTDNDMDIIVKYYDDKEISTLDLYAIVSDVEDTGREVVALIHDYIERIRSSRNHSEIRLELAEIANDYSVLAKRLGIPVIGAGQLNRKAADTIDATLMSNKMDVARLLGKGNISESFAVLKNIDSATLVHREIDAEGNEYMTFLDLKQRSRNGSNKKKKFTTYFAHPLENGIKLIPDIDLDEWLSKETLDESTAGLDVMKRGKSSRDIKELPVKKNYPVEETVELVDAEVIKDFRFLEDAIKKRKKVKEKSEAINENTVDEKFDKAFTQYTIDSYGRNESGYIQLFKVTG